jgi:hypothetical protein
MQKKEKSGILMTISILFRNLNALTEQKAHETNTLFERATIFNTTHVVINIPNFM